MSEKEELGLVEGWGYSVTTEKDSVSKGIFKGYAMIGSESAIVLQLSEGAVRFIPIARIMYIDLVESGERKRTDPAKPEPAYYG